MQERSRWVTVAFATALFGAGVIVGGIMQSRPVLHAQSGNHVFEIRTYTAPEGKLDALNARFRDHTMRIFARHGITSVGYFKPQDAPQSQNTLIYVLSHPSREAAMKNWAEFSADEEWKKVAAETQKNGPIVSKVERVFVDPADYSPMK